MKTLLVPAAMLLAAVTAVGCAGDTTDSNEEQIQQASTGTTQGGISQGDQAARQDTGTEPHGTQAKKNPTPTTQTAIDDTTQYVQGR